jgi:hypothetical protein
VFVFADLLVPRARRKLLIWILKMKRGSKELQGKINDLLQVLLSVIMLLSL